MGEACCVKPRYIIYAQLPLCNKLNQYAINLQDLEHNDGLMIHVANHAQQFLPLNVQVGNQMGNTNGREMICVVHA